MTSERAHRGTTQCASTIHDNVNVITDSSFAALQVESANTRGLFDCIVLNSEIDSVYMDIKEAISSLSPIIRNRLRGLPPYVLDYSDLIPSNR